MFQLDRNLKGNREYARANRVSDDVLSLDSWSEADGSTKPLNQRPTSRSCSISGTALDSISQAASLSRNLSTDSDSCDEWNSVFSQNSGVCDLTPSPKCNLGREKYQTNSRDNSVILNPQELTRVPLTCGSSVEKKPYLNNVSVGPSDRRNGADIKKQYTDHECYEPSHLSALANRRNFMYLPNSDNHKHSNVNKPTCNHESDSNAQFKAPQSHDNVMRYFKSKKTKPLKSKPSQSFYKHSSAGSPQFTKQKSLTNHPDQDTLSEHSEKVKTKLLSVWNNVKYGWTIKTKTNFRYDSPIFLLGKCYHSKASEEDGSLDNEYRVFSIEEFKKDFTSKVWFTYRREFPQINGTKFTTDCGWGCMLRSGQMMISQALIIHFLSRDWRLYNKQSRENIAYHRQILRWFGDLPSDSCPFSVHKLIEYGKVYGKEPGDWYGPASVAHIFRDALHRSWYTQPLLDNICIYVAQDCTIYLDDVADLCTMRSHSSSKLSNSTDSENEHNKYSQDNPNCDWKKAVIILIPVRLGGDELNEIYIPCVKSILAQDCCLGLIGGKPKHSLYFVGYQDEKLINLDPHYCQEFVDVTKREFPIHSFHCMSPRKTTFSKMDPSCTVGFFCRNKSEFEKFVKQTKEIVSPPKQKGLYPMFIFAEGRGADVSLEGLSFKEEGFLKVKHYQVDEGGNLSSEPFETEEFVVL